MKKKRNRLSKRERNVIFHALMNKAMEERELCGGDTWRTKWLENLADKIFDLNLGGAHK